MSDEVTEQLWAYLEQTPGAEITVDLPSQTITAGAISASFEIDPYVKWRLVEGLDDIGITMQQLEQITSF